MPRNRTPSLTHRLAHPTQPLTVHAQEFHLASPNPSPDSLSFHTVSVTSSTTTSTTPSEEMATLLDREHRVNRIQAAENTRLRSEVHRLRALTEANPATDAEDRAPSRDETAVVRSQLAAATARTALGDRQIAELEGQLRDVSARLRTAVRALEDKEREVERESYLVPSAERDRVKEVDRLMRGMSVGELNAASLALGAAMGEARARATVSVDEGDLFPRKGRRMGTGFRGGERPRSAMAGALREGQDDRRGVEGRKDAGSYGREEAGGMGPKMQAEVSPLASPEGYRSGDSGVFQGQKAVKFAEEGEKKRKGKFSASRFWSKK
ncbi:hypothetical protein CAC42_1351 [Sphaceloma murrayae]|uniref:Uncharacterized protein n=1 Tax=Sphaceloma murrayae TaxID=2082308 RepID=A0A2K1QG56_9PEZI|nr:hypothetical protein CAC42_1351 [Sphaceloma murrayae]